LSKTVKTRPIEIAAGFGYQEKKAVEGSDQVCRTAFTERWSRGGTMVKAIIFDMDGVIIDSEPMHLNLEREIFRRLGFAISDEDHWSYIGTTSYFMWDDLRNKFALPDAVEALVANERNEYTQYLLSTEEFAPIDGLRDLLAMLKRNQFRLAIASSSPLNIIEIVVDRLAIGRYFDVLVSGDQVQRSKPEPDIFLYAAQQMGVQPKNCLVIEDSANGIAAALKANMKSIGFSNPSSGKQDLSQADFVVGCLADITMDMLSSLPGECI